MQNMNEQEADQTVDRDQLIYNLSLTPEQRILYHQSALDLIWELKQAKSSDETKSQ